MDYTERLTLSYYKTIAVLNEAHQVFLVQHRQTDQICVKKVLSIYNPEIFRFLREHPIPGTPGILALWEEDGMLTVLEEYISGITLEERMRNAPLTPEEVLSLYSIIDRCVLPSEIFEILERTQPGIGGEIQLTDAMREIAVTDGMTAVEFEGRRYDMGNKFGILQAQIEVGLEHPETKDQLREYIKELAKTL